MQTFPDRDALAAAAASALARRLEGPGPVSLVATGGGTPGPVYDRLSAMELPWDRTLVALSDERFVDTADALSNERLIRQRLLTGWAGAADLLPLKGVGPTPEADALRAEAALSSCLPWSAVLLGMGEDGHIASLFPGDPDLAARLDLDGERLCVGVAAAGLAPFVPRISLTLRALVATGLVVLAITGEAKRAVIAQAQADPAAATPVAALLRQDRAPVEILWAP